MYSERPVKASSQSAGPLEVAACFFALANQASVPMVVQAERMRWVLAAASSRSRKGFSLDVVITFAPSRAAPLKALSR